MEPRERLVRLVESMDCSPEKERRIIDSLRGLKLARSYQESVMASGKLAAAQIERDRTFTERMRDKVRGGR